MKPARLERLAGSILLSALALFAGAAHAQTKLKWAHVYEAAEPFHQQALWAADEIKARTKGAVLVEVFPAGALGKEADLHQGLTLGTVDIIYTGMAFAGRIVPAMSIASGPFVFRDQAHWQAFRDSPVFSELAQQYEARSGGHHVAGATYYGQRHLTANKPVQGPDDMKDMKLRVPDAPLFAMFPKAVGAIPTPVPFEELYTALKNGTVDAQENPLRTIAAKKFLEVQQVLILTGHVTESLLTIVASGAWGKLPDAEKKIVGDVLWEASGRATKDVVQAENALVGEFEKRGKTVVKVDRSLFVQAVQKAGTSPDAPWPKELYERVQALK
jgi:tripartite ATP-independent transporter DctP family solute receptor